MRAIQCGVMMGELENTELRNVLIAFSQKLTTYVSHCNEASYCGCTLGLGTRLARALHDVLHHFRSYVNVQCQTDVIHVCATSEVWKTSCSPVCL